MKSMSKESTHIRIDKDLKHQLQVMAQCGETVNDVIRRLVAGDPAVNQRVNESVNMPSAPVTGDVNDKLTDLYQRVIVLETGSKMDGDYIDTLDEKVQTLETRTKYLMQVTHKLHPLLEDTQSVTLPDEPDPESDHEDHQAPDRQVTSAPGEWIVVTDEVRSQLVARVGDLQKAGMSYEKIGKLIGIGKGRISELHHGKMKKIHRAQYEALMKIPLEKPFL